VLEVHAGGGRRRVCRWRPADELLDEADDVVLKPYDKGRAAMEAYLPWRTLDEERAEPHALK